jgi:uncharacterized protein with HEPN domain
MSLRDPQKYLYDIVSSCGFILEFTEAKTVEDYKNDRAFRSALERELQIIGEAMLQLDRVAPEIAEKIPEYRNIIGFRHVLVHGYDALDPATVWNVVETKLDGLHDKVQSILKEYR